MFERYRRMLSTGVALLDIVLINLAFALAYWARYDLQLFREVEAAYDQPYSVYLPISLVLTALLLGVYKLGGVYNLRRGASWFDEVYKLFTGTATGIILMVFFTFFYRPFFYSRLIYLYAAVLILVFLAVARLGQRLLRDRLRRRGLGVDRVLIVGAGETGRTVMRNIVAQPALGYHVVGFVDDDPEKGSTDIGRFKALGVIANLPRLVQELAIDEVIITLPWMYHRKIVSVVAQCEREQIEARIVPDLFQMTLSQVDIDDLGGIPMIGVREISIQGVSLLLKRSMDVALAVLLVILLSPLLLIIALAIKVDSAGPILFRQIRVGKGDRLFTCFKFRSMHVDAEQQKATLQALNEADGPLFKIREDPRRTAVGRIIRRMSLDELPQLYNVLRGDMSLVGPRPPLPEEVQRYQPWHKKRLEVAPGITGLWQVSGRSQLTFDEMVLLDLYYIENWSPALDLEILIRTIPMAFSGLGAY